MNANRKRWTLWGLLGAILAVVIVFLLLPRPVLVDLVEIVPKPLVVTVAEEGRTRVHDVFVLSSPVAGRVQRLESHAGDPVIAGETVLARIEPVDPSLLDPRSEAQAQAALKAAESARNLAEAEVDQASAELEFAESERRRAVELAEVGTISGRELDEATRRHKTAVAQLATARAALQMRLFEVDQARAQLVKPVHPRSPAPACECVPITAPVSGHVLRVFNHSERVVAAGEPLLEIGDSRNLEIEVDFLSTDAVRISPGQRVIISNWGGEHSLEGMVRSVEPFGITKTSALGIDEQRVNVIIDFVGDASDREPLGHGYQVEARVVLWESDAVLTVPITALVRVADGWAVYKSADGRARLTPIELGLSDGRFYAVTEGLQAGDRIVAYPSNRVVDGIRLGGR